MEIVTIVLIGLHSSLYAHPNLYPHLVRRLPFNPSLPLCRRPLLCGPVRSTVR